MRSSRTTLLSAAIVAASMAGCGDGGSPTTPASPPVAVTPTPAPTATPTPTPTSTPGTQSCRLPSMPECASPEGPSGVFGCCRAERVDVYGAQVDAAIRIVQQTHPEWFDGGDRLLGNPDDYVIEVAYVLQARFGLCAKPGPTDDEVAVKGSNDFSEQYDVLYSSGYVRVSGYEVTCRPARF
jgi:hypothetical protein